MTGEVSDRFDGSALFYLDKKQLITWHGHVAVSSQGMQDHLGAKSANWLAS